MTDWTQRYENAWVHQSDYTSLDAELSDMLSRHPGWDGRIVDPPARVPAPASPTTVPGRSTDTSITQDTHRGMGNRSSDVEQWAPLVAGHFKPEDVERVLCLITHESGGNASARNTSSGASGLLQIMPFWAAEYGVSKADLFTPEINLFIGRKIRDSQGWTAWAPYNRGLCR